MTVEPERKIEKFAQAGVALNPSTPLSSIEEILYDADVVLLMTAIPGAELYESIDVWASFAMLTGE